jgi:hypothetical protein
MNFRNPIIVLLGSLLTSVTYASEFCYYWVSTDGSVTTYAQPPFNVSGPPFGGLASNEGRLLIVQTRGPCEGSRLKKPERRMRLTDQSKTLSGSLSSISGYQDISGDRRSSY